MGAKQTYVGTTSHGVCVVSTCIVHAALCTMLYHVVAELALSIRLHARSCICFMTHFIYLPRTVLRIENVATERVIVQIDWGNHSIDTRELDPMCQVDLSGQPHATTLQVQCRVWTSS